MPSEIKLFRLVLGDMVDGPEQWLHKIPENLRKTYPNPPNVNLQELLEEGETETIVGDRRFYFMDYDRDYWVLECPDDERDPWDILKEMVNEENYVDLSD